MFKVGMPGLIPAVLGLVLLGGVFASASRAQERPPLEAYGASPAVELMELSPSGDLVARIAVVGEERAIAVSRISTGEHLFAAVIGEAKVRDLRWIGEERVLIVSSQTRGIPSFGVPRSELFFGLILNLENNQIDLHRIDLNTGRGRSVEPMTRETEDHVLDASGEVIALARYVERTGRWSLMLPRGRGFREAWSVDAPVDTPVLHGLGRTPRTIVISADRPDLAAEDADAETPDVLFEVDVDTGEWTRLPFEHHPRLLIPHPETRLLIGAQRIEEDGVRYEFIEPTAARRWRSIERAFPGKTPVLSSWSDDLKKILVFTDTGESGLYQIVDFDRGVADVLAVAYPAIPAEQVGAQRAIQYKAADGLEIAGYLTLPPGVTTPEKLPLVVLAHGGPQSRDVAGFDYWAQAIASRGYAVLQANFRGSTGYGLAFIEAGHGEWGRKMQTDLSDGVRWLAEEGIIDPERVCIVGASYGGYAAMAGLTLDGEVYRCGVAVSGVSDLRRMVQWEARQEGGRNNQTIRYWNRFMGAARFNDRALDDLSPARLAEAVEAPLLLIHGRDDTVVPIEQSRLMADAMRRAGKPVEFVELRGEDHWMSRADTRQKMLTETVRFLEAHNPVD